jgi:hypothetical protein
MSMSSIIAADCDDQRRLRQREPVNSASMRFTESCALAAAAVLTAFATAAQDSVLADLAARVEFGFYSDDPTIVVAARAALDRLPGDDPAVREQRALAALRMAQLTAARGGEIDAWIADCLEHADSPEVDRRRPSRGESAAEAEAAILTAACSLLAARSSALKSAQHLRRMEQALARARSLDPDNPRLPLLAAWRASAPSAANTAVALDAVEAELERAVAAFEARGVRGGSGWGEAEALAQLGELRLTGGEIRAARDLIERALLVAPEYHYAEALRTRLQAGQ